VTVVSNTTPWSPSPRERERELFRRALHNRQRLIALVSTVLVLGTLGVVLVTSPGWQSVKTTFFDIEYKKLQEILKASSFTTDTNKIYLYGQPDGIYCELGDKEKSNTDNITLKVVDKIEGQPLTQALPFNLDIFRVLSGVKFDKARVGINLKFKIMSFYVKPTDETEFKFIISGLVK
jgi:hypothetical protein